MNMNNLQDRNLADGPRRKRLLKNQTISLSVKKRRLLVSTSKRIQAFKILKASPQVCSPKSPIRFNSEIQKSNFSRSNSDKAPCLSKRSPLAELKGEVKKLNCHRRSLQPAKEITLTQQDRLFQLELVKEKIENPPPQGKPHADLKLGRKNVETNFGVQTSLDNATEKCVPIPRSLELQKDVTT